MSRGFPASPRLCGLPRHFGASLCHAACPGRPLLCSARGSRELFHWPVPLLMAPLSSEWLTAKF